MPVMSRIALAASVTHAIVALGHTVHGINTFSLPPYQNLPALLRCYAKSGWYQGSLFFGMLSLFTYQLSQRPPATWTRIDRAIMTGLAVLYWGSTAWYLKHGDRPTGTVTAVGGLITAATLAQ